MSLISEFSLIKECVENPRTLDKSLSTLNMQFIRDPADKDGEGRYGSALS